MGKLNLNQMTHGKAHLLKKIVLDFIWNQMNCERTQLNQRDSGRPQIKSNDPWQSSTGSKTLANIKLNQMIHGRVQLVSKHHSRIQRDHASVQIKSNDSW